MSHSVLNVEIIHQNLNWIRCHAAVDHTTGWENSHPPAFLLGEITPNVSFCETLQTVARNRIFNFSQLCTTENPVCHLCISEKSCDHAAKYNQMRLCQTHKVCSLFKIIRAIRKNKHFQIESDKYCNLQFYCRPFNQKHCSFMRQQADTSDCSADDQVVIMAVQKLEACWTICGGVFEECVWFGGQLSNSHH